MEDWLAYFGAEKEGTKRLRRFLRYHQQREKLYYELVKLGVLLQKFAPEPINFPTLKGFLYEGRGLSLPKRNALVAYLGEHEVLKVSKVLPRHKDSILRELHSGLMGFLDLPPEDSVNELVARVAGQYWIYRPSVHHPSHFVRGLLTVDKLMSGDQVTALRVTEKYAVEGDKKSDGPISKKVNSHDFAEFYEGIMLQTWHHPFMLSSLRLTPHPHKKEQTEDRTVFRVTLIAWAQTHTDGHMVSMTGLTAVNYAVGGVLATPICFERVPPEYKPIEKDLCILSSDELPPSVRDRLAHMSLDANKWVKI